MGTVAIIGGGTGGASTAHLIRRKLGSSNRVILIEQKAEVYNHGVYPLVATGKRRKKDCTRKIARLNRGGISVINVRAGRVDHHERIIYTENQEIKCDLAIIATGAEVNPGVIPGMAEGGLDAQSPDGAEKILSRLEEFEGGKIALLVTSSCIKCPAAPYEYAFLIEDWLRRRGRGNEINITIYTPEPAPLYKLGPRTADAVSELLLKRKIVPQLKSRVVKVDPGARRIECDGGTYPFDLLIYFAENFPPPLLKESGLAGKGGWLEVDRHLQVAGQDRVLGLGDATRIITPAGRPLPKMGAIAHLQSFVAAANGAQMLMGKRGGRSYGGLAG